MLSTTNILQVHNHGHQHTPTQPQARTYDISEASNDNCGSIVSWIAVAPLLNCAEKGTSTEAHVTVTDKGGDFAACRAVVDIVESTHSTILP